MTKAERNTYVPLIVPTRWNPSLLKSHGRRCPRGHSQLYFFTNLGLGRSVNDRGHLKELFTAPLWQLGPEKLTNQDEPGQPLTMRKPQMHLRHLRTLRTKLKKLKKARSKKKMASEMENNSRNLCKKFLRRIN